MCYAMNRQVLQVYFIFVGGIFLCNNEMYKGGLNIYVAQHLHQIISILPRFVN